MMKLFFFSDRTTKVLDLSGSYFFASIFSFDGKKVVCLVVLGGYTTPPPLSGSTTKKNTFLCVCLPLCPSFSFLIGR